MEKLLKLMEVCEFNFRKKKLIIRLLKLKLRNLSTEKFCVKNILKERSETKYYKRN